MVSMFLSSVVQPAAHGSIFLWPANHSKSFITQDTILLQILI